MDKENPHNLMTYEVFKKITTGKSLKEIYNEYNVPSFPGKFRLKEDIIDDLKDWGFNKSIAMRLQIFSLLMECGNFTDAHRVIIDLDKLKDLYPAEKKQLDISILSDLTTKVSEVIKKTIPENCPHCKKSLYLKDETIKELERMSSELK